MKINFKKQPLIFLPLLSVGFLLVTVQTTSAAYLPPGTDCALYGSRPNCVAMVNGKEVQNNGICDQYKSTAKCGCTPSAEYRGGVGECPDGVEDGSSIQCRSSYNGKVGLKNCNNVGSCGNEEALGACESDADCIDPSASVCEEGFCMPEEDSDGSGSGKGKPKPCSGNDQCSSNCCSSGVCVSSTKCEMTCGYIDCQGSIQGSAIDEDGNPTIEEDNYESEDFCRISRDVNTEWAAKLRVKSWSAGARTKWIQEGQTYWLAGSGSDDAVCTNCSNTCPGSGPWIKINTTKSMDCVYGGSTEPGSEGIKQKEADCETCSAGWAEKCTAEVIPGSYNIRDLAFSSSCKWDYHCRVESRPCGRDHTWECSAWDADGNNCESGSTTCEPSQQGYTAYWYNDYVSGCGQKSQCLRQLKANLTRHDSSDGTCAEETDYEVVFNESTCAWSSGSLPLGTTADWSDMNPAICKAKEHTANFYVNGEDSGKQGFVYNGQSGRCEAPWTRLEAPDGVMGLSTAWGEAGSNGRWILLNGNNSNTGWKFDDATCTFYCEGYDGGADCYGKELDARLAFVPDLRLVVYRDNGFVAKDAPNSGYMGEFDDNCSSSPSKENDNLNTAINQSAESYKTKREAIYHLDNDGRGLVPIKNVFQAGNYQRNIYAKLLSAPAASPVVTEMILGVDSSGQSIKNSEYNLSVDIQNLFNSTTDEGYWACSCPSVDAGDNYRSTADCNLWFFPGRDVDICTTKRIYVGFRDCYTSPWWQVSGGNVFASQDIVDAIPTGLNSDPNCSPIGNPRCEDVNPPNGHVNDLPTIESSQNIPFDESCTPRIIRGRTPCKIDGPSNSAGIALSQYGQIYAADEYDYYFLNSNLDETVKNSYLRRVTERSNLHALYQGKYGVNINNPAGVQSRVASSRVVPTGEHEGDGYRPPREDWRYFVALAGGIEKLQSIPGSKGDLKVDNLDQLKSRCSTNENEEGISYLCYVSRDLIISSDQPWIVGKAENGKPQDFTVFVDGNLILQGNNDDSNAVTVVDIGNFLGFVVNGDITVEANVGVKMPEPTSSEIVKRCWEGQSATINGQYPKNDEIRANQESAVGSVEGIFIANGSLIIDTYPAREGDVEDYCRVDKRFIGQGSFIAWNQIKMLRNFTPRNAGCQNDVYGVYNSRVPTETFIYRPDLIRNTPSWMKRSITTYQEITGTTGR